MRRLMPVSMATQPGWPARRRQRHFSTGCSARRVRDTTQAAGPQRLTPLPSTACPGTGQGHPGGSRHASSTGSATQHDGAVHGRRQSRANGSSPCLVCSRDRRSRPAARPHPGRAGGDPAGRWQLVQPANSGRAGHQRHDGRVPPWAHLRLARYPIPQGPDHPGKPRVVTRGRPWRRGSSGPARMTA
jgi:hypothetical protein